jgi:SNF family Na+-dependent transporter
MDRHKLEASATLAALGLLVVMLVGGVIAIADGVFRWDLLSEGMERVAIFLMATLFVLLVACVLVSVMLNLSIIAQKLSEAVDRGRKE